MLLIHVRIAKRNYANFGGVLFASWNLTTPTRTGIFLTPRQCSVDNCEKRNVPREIVANLLVCQDLSLSG